MLDIITDRSIGVDINMLWTCQGCTYPARNGLGISVFLGLNDLRQISLSPVMHKHDIEHSSLILFIRNLKYARAHKVQQTQNVHLHKDVFRVGFR